MWGCVVVRTWRVVWNFNTWLGIWLMRYVAVSTASPIIGEHIGTDNFKQVSIFPFSHSILLRSVYTRTYMNNSMVWQVSTKNGVEIILCIVGFENLDLAFKLGWNHGMKGLKNCGCFGFFFHEKFPCGSCVIVDKCDKPLSPIDIFRTWWFPNIIVNYWKRMWWFIW